MEWQRTWEELPDLAGRWSYGTDDSGFVFVFVHGVRATHIDTWDNIPEKLCVQLGASPDILNFRYPARSWERAGIHAAARRLEDALRLHLVARRHRHVIFFTHSTGGIVVRRMLDRWHGENLERLHVRSVGTDMAWMRTRAIVDFDVPHLGGAIGLTTIGCVCAAILGIPLWLTQMARFICTSMGGPNYLPAWGWNRIFWGLHVLNPRLHLLRRRHVRQTRRMDELAYPRPATLGFLAYDAGVVRQPRLYPGRDSAERQTEFDRDKFEYVRIPGSQHGPKPTQYDSSRSPWLKYLAERLAGVRAPLAADIARKTLEELLRDRFRVDRLTDGQTGLLDWIDELVASRERVVWVSGPAGVGKSTVLRTLARRMCGSYMRDFFTPGRPLPLFFQLRILVPSLRFPTSPARLLAAFLREWRKLVEPGLSGRTAVRATLSSPDARVVVIIDSLDEFIAHNPRVGRSNVKQALLLLFRRLDALANVTVVIATRSSMDDVYLAGTEAQRTLEAMTPAECAAAFPRVSELLNEVPDDVRAMLLKPLFADIFEGSSDAELGAQLQDPRTAFERAVGELLNHGQVVKASGLDTHTLTAALAAICFEMFCGFRPSITDIEVEDAARRSAAAWVESGSRVSIALTALTQQPLRTLLFERTIFRPAPAPASPDARRTGAHYAVYHMEFQDFLVGRHLAECLLHERFESLERRAFTVPIFLIAAAELSARRFSIGGDFVNRIVERVTRTGNWMPFGSTGAIIGNSKLPLVDGAERALLNGMDPNHTVRGTAGQPKKDNWQLVTIRFIMLSSWCRRTLRDSAAAFRQLLVSHDASLASLWSYISAAPVDSVTRSLAWSYLYEFARSDVELKAELAAHGWKLPTVPDAVSILHPDGLSPVEKAHARAYQEGFLSLAQAIRSKGEGERARIVEADRLINALHYAYCLATIVRESRCLDDAILDERSGLHAVLAPSAPVANLVAASDTPEHLRTLYQAARALI